MKRTHLMALVIVAALGSSALITTSAVAGAQQGPPMSGQGGPGMRGGQRPGMGMGNPQVVIRMKTVQRHLKLTADQIAEVDALRPPRGPGMGGPGMGGPGQGGPGGPGMGGPGMGPDPLAEILQPAQYARLKQLTLQFDAPMSFRNPMANQALKLTQAQLESLHEIIQNAMPQPEPGTRPDWATMQAAKAKAQKQAWTLLTNAQKQAWSRLTGQVFSDWEQPIMPGGLGQGGRGQGGRGQGGRGPGN